MAGSIPRNHHYVPQFYLRNFSADRRQINLFNFRGEGSHLGPVKGQCAIRRFYSPEKEKEFARLEAIVAPSLRSLLDDPASLSDAEVREALLAFVVLQSLRTDGAARMPEKLAAQVKELAVEHGVDEEEIRRALSLTDMARGEEMLLCGEQSLARARDLEMCLVENTSNLELITCDDPVVRYNQYCWGSANAENGWGMVGLQVLFPLTPRHLLLLYDPQVYEIRRPLRSGSVVRTSRARDVTELNALQILHAQDNIYYLGAKGRSSTESQCRGRARLRSPAMVIELHQASEQGTKWLVTNYLAPLKHEMSLSFLSVRKDYAGIPPELRWGNMRTGTRYWRRRPDLRGGRKPDRVTRR